MPLATAQRSPRIRKGFVFASRKSGLLSSITPASCWRKAGKLHFRHGLSKTAAGGSQPALQSADQSGGQRSHGAAAVLAGTGSLCSCPALPGIGDCGNRGVSLPAAVRMALEKGGSLLCGSQRSFLGRRAAVALSPVLPNLGRLKIIGCFLKGVPFGGRLFLCLKKGCGGDSPRHKPLCGATPCFLFHTY